MKESWGNGIVNGNDWDDGGVFFEGMEEVLECVGGDELDLVIVEKFMGWNVVIGGGKWLYGYVVDVLYKYKKSGGGWKGEFVL